ncbi:MAG: glycosyltransferase family 39 protein [Cyanobacteriota bacterium]|nr:glycosyltransferase family 39 protein [Cyanobacteriota bacterium]
MEQSRNNNQIWQKFAIFFSNIRWFWIFLAAAIALWTISLGNVPLRDWDEGSHAIVARELYRTGNWLYLTFFGQPYFMKPPLGYWIVASSYHLFGSVSEFSTRLPVAFISAFGVPLLYLVGREIFPRRLSAVLSASVYLTLLPVVRHGRLMMLDGIINTFFIFFLLCLLKARKHPPWAMGMGLGLAGIALTKGILVFALGAIAGLFVLCDRDWSIFKNPYAWLGLFLGTTLTLSWYYAQWVEYGNLFVEIHLGSQNFDRLATAVEGNDGPPWYYLVELLKYSFPWLVFWPGGLLLAFDSNSTEKSGNFAKSLLRKRESWANLVLAGTILFLGTISLMGTKLPWYIMPLYPFFSLAVGAKLAQMVRSRQPYSRFFIAFFGLLAVVGLGGCVYFILADPQPVLIIMGFVVAVTMGWVAWQLQQNRPQFIPVLGIGMYVTLVLLMLSTSWNWELNEQFPVVRVGALIRENTPPDVVYTSFAYNRPSLDFYSDRAVLAADLPALEQHWQEGRYLLLDPEAVTALTVPDSAIVGTADGWTLVRPRDRQ